tara:strand:- start:26368 stop:26988 length:621 start_codon:yes stop_codon:yes gene_type:complete
MRRLTVILSVLFMLCSTAYADPAVDPTTVLKQMTSKTIAELQKDKSSIKTDKTAVYGIIKRYLMPHVDTDLMSASVLGRATWTKATAPQKKEFVGLFTQLLIHTYSAALASYTNEDVTFAPIRGGYQGKMIVQVSGTIERKDAPSVDVVYHMADSHNQWMVYDLSIEGISMLQSYKTQFEQIVKNQGMTGLLKTLKQHIQQMKQSS